MAVTTGKIARKYMAHFLDSGSLCGGTSGYERLGKDLEEYNVELNPDTETSKTSSENQHLSITDTKYLLKLTLIMQKLTLYYHRNYRKSLIIVTQTTI